MSAVFAFDSFRLCPARRELTRNGQRLELPASAFDCLVYLVQHRERAVGRDELIAAVWGLSDISENLLAQTVVRIRRVLGDENANTQRSIRTVTKFGYHWVARTSLHTEATPEHAAPAQAGAAAPGDSAASARGCDVIVLPAVVDALGNEADWLRLGIMELVACHLRCANLPVTRSEEVVVLLHVFPALAQAQADDERDLPLRAPRRVYPTVRRHSANWRVELTCRDAQHRFAVDAVDVDVTIAARKASGELLSRLSAA